MKFKLFMIIALTAVLGCTESNNTTDDEAPSTEDPATENPDSPKADCENVDLTSNDNCGQCGNKCGNNSSCAAGVCQCDEGYSDCDGNNSCETEGECICHAGETMPCYSGSPETENVGNCHGGQYHCVIDEEYGADWDYICEGEYAPFSYPICSADNPKGDSDCNGIPDYLQDEDDDGFAACSSFGTVTDCCDSAFMCKSTAPELVNPGKLIDCKGNHIDDDCDGEIDEDDILCETGTFADNKCPLNARQCDGTLDEMDNWATRVKSNEAALAMANSMNLCMDVVSASSGKAGIIEYSLSKSSSSGSSINPIFDQQVAILGGMLSKDNKTSIPPRIGTSFLMLSTGIAGDARTVSNTDKDWSGGELNEVPQLYLNAHENKLQSHPKCGLGGIYTSIFDSAVLHFKLKAPTTAQGFSFDFRFFTKEYPFYICSAFNDFFLTVVTDENGKPFIDTDGDNSLLDEDGNVSFDKQGNAVSVNNAFFTTCAAPDCNSNSAMGFISSNGCPANMTCSEQNKCGTCEDGYSELYAYTSSPYTGTGNGSINRGGGTAWLTTNVPVTPGQVFNLDFYIWDTGDHAFDSSVIIDNFRWHCDETVVGTDFAKPIEEIN